jgi:hypothetical protein
MNTWFNASGKDHRRKHKLDERVQREGAARCAANEELPPAEPPPNATRFLWNDWMPLNYTWQPRAYNYLARRVLGRCSAGECTCRVAGSASPLKS